VSVPPFKTDTDQDGDFKLYRGSEYTVDMKELGESLLTDMTIKSV